MDLKSDAADSQHMRIYGSKGPIRQTFEGLMSIVENWPGMHFELDGSFVWVNRGCALPWQLDGMVYDRAGAIEYVELRGRCPAEEWRSLCSVIAGGDIASEIEQLDDALRVQLVQSGVFIKPSEYVSSPKANAL